MYALQKQDDAPADADAEDDADANYADADADADADACADADADADADDDADDFHDLFFFYGKGGRCFSHCPGSSKGCAPHWKDWKAWSLKKAHKYYIGIIYLTESLY